MFIIKGYNPEYQIFSLKSGKLVNIKISYELYSELKDDFYKLSENQRKKFQFSLDNYIKSVLSYNC